jgi:hypothetical protein
MKKKKIYIFCVYHIRIITKKNGYSCMFQVEICSQQLEICKSVSCLSFSSLLWRLINFRLFCSDDCRSLYLVKNSFSPMIADQEKINGCVLANGSLNKLKV